MSEGSGGKGFYTNVTSLWGVQIIAILQGLMKEGPWYEHSGDLKYSGDLNSGNIWIVNFYIIVIRYKVFDEQHQRAGQNIQPTKKSEKLIK